MQKPSLKKRIFTTFKVLLALLVLLFLALWYWLQPPNAAQETLFIGGTIITVDENNPQVEAVLVRDGRIIAVGDEASVKQKASPSASIIDLEGNTMLPGFIEPHTHPVSTATLSTVVDVSGFSHKNRAEVITTLKKGIAEDGNNGWVLAFGWDPVMIDDLHAPSLQELNDLSPDKPLIILTQMMHDTYANSLALEAAGITKDTAAPKGAEFLKDENGQLTGTVREVRAIEMLMNSIPKPPEGAFDYLLASQLPKYAQAGYTTLGAMGLVVKAEDPIGLFQRVSGMANSPVRTVTYALPQQLNAESKPESSLKAGGIIGVKFWMDGSPFAGGAAFEDPYENTDLVRKRLHLGHNHLAALNYDMNNFEALYKNYHNRGYQIAVHVQGERAVDQVLNAAEAAITANPRTNHRHRLEHNALITQKQLERAHRLGMTTSFFVDHVYFYGHALKDLVGQERVSRYMPLKTALRTGQKISLHTDNPATPINALRAMQTARQRLSRIATVSIAPKEALSAKEALKAMTIDAAWQLKLEQETGSIEVGKSADFVILTENPLETDTANLQAIKVQATWLRGQPTEWRSFNNNSFKALVKMIKKMLF